MLWPQDAVSHAKNDNVRIEGECSLSGRKDFGELCCCVKPRQPACDGSPQNQVLLDLRIRKASPRVLSRCSELNTSFREAVFVAAVAVGHM